MNKNVYLSAIAGKQLIEYLKTTGFHPVLLTGTFDGNITTPVYKEVSTHADIHMCKMGVWENSQIFHGNIGKLGNNYPGNIIYNAVCTEKYFVHNLKYTDSELLQAVKNRHHGISLQNGKIHALQEVSVSQGYTRCCCLPVDDDAFITSDDGINKALIAAGAEVLLIRPGHISLPGFDYGFIGGCGGNLIIEGKRTIVFNGDLSSHPDYEKIAAFIKCRDIDMVFFKDYPLTDIGSILA